MAIINLISSFYWSKWTNSEAVIVSTRQKYSLIILASYLQTKQPSSPITPKSNCKRWEIKMTLPTINRGLSTNKNSRSLPMWRRSLKANGYLTKFITNLFDKSCKITFSQTRRLCQIHRDNLSIDLPILLYKIHRFKKVEAEANLLLNNSLTTKEWKNPKRWLSVTYFLDKRFP